MPLATRALRRLLGIAGVALAASWAVWRAAPAAAQDGPTFVFTPAPEYEFGQAITFTVEIEGATPIRQVDLHLAAPDGAQQVWMDVPFEPGEPTTARLTLDLGQQSLAPFSTQTFWWVAVSEGKPEAISPAGTFDYNDNRFGWRSAGSGNLKVHWYSGSAEFGQAALEVAAGSLARINQDLRAPLPEHQDIYIYASAADIKASLQRVGQPWANGHADPALGIILVVAADDLRSAVTLEREIPHEMTHVLVYKATGDHFGEVPVWLNEGLAVMNQGERDSAYAARLAAARDAHAFLPLASLCGIFPTESDAAALAYAQSESVVRYLRARFGSEGIYALLQAYARGAACDTGLNTGLGLHLDELEAAWLRDAIYAATEAPGRASLGPWLVLSALVVLSPFGALWALMAGRQRAKPT
ncbi:MAG: hypothetical protein IT317_01990 [Anaerolineales bacterium]|nr:hypothetical protein [Anaerolineales bacterium]